MVFTANSVASEPVNIADRGHWEIIDHTFVPPILSYLDTYIHPDPKIRIVRCVVDIVEFKVRSYVYLIGENLYVWVLEKEEYIRYYPDRMTEESIIETFKGIKRKVNEDT